MPTLVNPMVIELPALELRRANKFTDVAVDIADRFIDDGVNRAARGASFMSIGALQPIVSAYWCNIDDNKGTANITITKDTQAGILSFNFLQCSALSGDLDWMTKWVDQTVGDLASHALAFMITTQMLPAGHMNLLEDGVNVGPGSTIIDALERVEDGLAERASNYRGTVFVPIRRLAELVSLGVLGESGPDVGLVTPAGHRVVADAGHQGDNTIFGTTQLGYAVQSSVDLNDYVSQLNRVHNDIRWMAELYAIAVFNKNHTVYATVTGSSL
jgi:hypothetical protein